MHALPLSLRSSSFAVMSLQANAAGELRLVGGLRGLDLILKNDLDVLARDAAEYAIESINISS